MLSWRPEAIAAAAGAELVHCHAPVDGPTRTVIDSRRAGPGTLFVGLPGAHVDGGDFAPQALCAGAWGVLTGRAHAERAMAAASGNQVVLVADDPLRSLQTLANRWRRELEAAVIGVTGSTGKTSTKELLRAVIAPHRRTHASEANFNTEIGLPLEVLAAPDGTEVLILEMGMRGRGQIAELAAIAEPDVAVIVSIGPVHLELMGSLEAIAAAKAELIAGLRPGGTAVVPAGEPLLAPYLRDDVETVEFGDRGDVRAEHEDADRMEISARGERVLLEVSFEQPHLRRNLLAAVAAAQAIGVLPGGRLDYEVGAGRGRRITVPGGITVIDDCYNANPMSMRAALEDLARLAGEGGRRVAVLGDMLELGPQERRFHREIGEIAARSGVDVLITVGPLAADMAAGSASGSVYAAADATEAAALAQELLEPGDTVLVKASNGVGLKLVVDALCAGAPA